MELGPLLLSDILVSSGSMRLSIFIPQIPTTRATSLMMCLNHFLLPWNELLLPTNSCGRKPAFFSFVVMSKKRNHPCFSLMQSHTIFNTKMQCNVFLPHVLLTRRQFQRLKCSVCPSVYIDDLIFIRKNWLIIATCCLHCRTNRLRRLVRLSINTAIEKNPVKKFCKVLEMELKTCTPVSSKFVFEKIKFKVLHYIQHDFIR